MYCELMKETHPWILLLLSVTSLGVTLGTESEILLYHYSTQHGSGTLEALYSSMDGWVDAFCIAYILL